MTGSGRSAAVGISCITVFVGLLVAVSTGGLDGNSIDQRVSARSHRIVLHHHTLLSAARDVTVLGSPLVVDVLTVVAAVMLLLLGRRREAIVIAVVRVITWLLTDGVKATVDRARPQTAMAFGHWSGSSFPSGHASGAASIYLPLAAVLAARLTARGPRVATVAAAAVISIGVATSRVLLGAHYLSDVIAGLLLASGVLALCWATAQHEERLPISKPDGPPTGPVKKGNVF